jgi:hypothetical protein
MMALASLLILAGFILVGLAVDRLWHLPSRQA